MPDVEVFVDSRCQKYHPNINISHICHSPVDRVSYANLTPTKGSALQKHYNNNFHVIGIFSYFFANTNPVVLVASRTSLYNEWLENIVWPQTNTVNRLPKLSCGHVSETELNPENDGRVANPVENPWNVAIFYKNSETEKVYICGGTIITDRIVVTAANCLYSANGKITADRLSVYLGIFDLEMDAKKEGWVVKYLTIHENYNVQTRKNDIALIGLEHKIVFNNYIRPICLTDTTDKLVDRTGSVVGWGLNSNNVRSIQLHKASLSLKSKCHCLDDKDNGYEVMQTENFCAAYVGGDDENCTAESGAGMAYENDDGKWFLKGIVSSGRHSSNPTKLCDISKFILLTDVSNYFDWIENKLNEYVDGN